MVATVTMAMKGLSLKLWVLVLCNGCVVSYPMVRETITTNGVTTIKEVRLTSWAFWPGTQNIEKERATLGRTLSIGMNGLEQDGGGTNVVEALRAIDSILGKIR